jgi:DNA polymerase V
MGTPLFMVQEELKQYNVKVFSSNYTLYGDMSDRVMTTLSGFVPQMEIYSIDEAFLDMHNLPHENLLKLGGRIRATVLRNTGIPTCVGIAPTKTLAKMANRYAKKKYKSIGVFWAADMELIQEMLEYTEVGDIWGIGRQYAMLLSRSGFKTAADLLKAPEDWVRQKMSVVGLRLLSELKGVPAIQWELIPPAKKNICTSRSFGIRITGKNELAVAVSNYAAACALKLRTQKFCASRLNIFIQTNPHKPEEGQYYRSIDIDLLRPTNSTSEIIKFALRALDMIYKSGFKYMKAGVTVNDLVPESQVQTSLFDTMDREKDDKVMNAMDKINRALGRDTVRMAVQGFDRRYKMKAEYLSQRYTTNYNELLNIKI